MKKYTKVNEEAINSWVKEGWIAGTPISLNEYKEAKRGNFNLKLTPTKNIPNNWLLPKYKNKKVLGLAAGGAQQMPIFKALGAEVTCLDISDEQLRLEEEFSKLAGYEITLIKGDITKELPFLNDSFDYIFFPLANVYIYKTDKLFKEFFIILKEGGILVSGLDNGLNFAFDDEDGKIMFPLPFNPLLDDEQYDYMVENNYGIQFSHTITESIKGQLDAGFKLLDMYEDTNLSGKLKDNNVPTFIATKVIKEV